jgi:hypothetical protein
LRETIVDARGHAKSVQLYLVQHCGPDGAFSTGWQSWGGIQLGSGDGAP